MPTPVPNSISIQRHPDDPSRFSLMTHLRVEFSTARQYNTPWAPWPEIENLLRQWYINRERFLLRHFGWRAQDVDAHIRAHGDTRPRKRNGPGDNLTLADLGL